MTVSSTLTTPTVLEALRAHQPDPSLLERFDPDAQERQRINLSATLDPGLDLDLWLISWPPDTRTGWHDHGLASGAFTVLLGALTECSWDGVVHARTLTQGGGRAFGPSHIHDVVNTSGEHAVSLHAYAPKLTTMTRYHLDGRRLEVTGVERAEAHWRGQR
jgi:predicted metal-dependent enzyme (double-stranded beta helix superfamily)